MSSATPTPDSRVVTQIRFRAILFLVMAIAAGGGSVVLVKRYLDRAKGANAGAGTTLPVVIAKVDVPIAARLEEKHLQVIQWPKDHVPAGAFDNVQELIDRTLIARTLKGEPLLEHRLADAKKGRGMAALLSPGMRAMAVKVDPVVGVAGFVQPGDYVDVITTMSPDSDTQKGMTQEPAKISKIILQNILVLAVGEHLQTTGSKPVPVKVVTLALIPDETERLALASMYGKITLTMRSRIDQDEALTEGATPVALLAPDGELAKPEEVVTKPVTQKRQRYRRKKAEPKEVKPEAPIVEILRGSRIEERKLTVQGSP